MINDSVQKKWDAMSSTEKIQTVRVAIAMSRNICSDDIADETIIGSNPGDECELGMLTRLTIYTTPRTTFRELITQLKL